MSDSATPWPVACQALLSMGFPRQGYWNGLPYLCPGDLLHPGVKLHLSCISRRVCLFVFTTSTTLKALYSFIPYKFIRLSTYDVASPMLGSEDTHRVDPIAHYLEVYYGNWINTPKMTVWWGKFFIGKAVYRMLWCTGRVYSPKCTCVWQQGLRDGFPKGLTFSYVNLTATFCFFRCISLSSVKWFRWFAFSCAKNQTLIFFLSSWKATS